METDQATRPTSAIRRDREPLHVALLLALLPFAVFTFIGLQVAARTFLIEAFENEGPSMEPLLHSGERFIVDKRAFGVFLPMTSEQRVHWATPSAGDVVVLKSPMDGVDVVKRVIGVPRDRIELRERGVLRNGESLAQAEVECPLFATSIDDARATCFSEQLGGRSFITRYDRSDPSAGTEVTVPDGHVYVLGDNRSRSNDSRNPQLGFVSVRRIKGLATRIYWTDLDSTQGGDRLFSVIQ